MTTFHGAAIQRSTNQVITPPQFVSFDTVLFDTNSFFSLGNPTRLTIPTADKYLFGFTVILDPINTPGGEIIVELNGTGTGLLVAGNDATITFSDFSATGIADFAANDYIELDVSFDATVSAIANSIAEFWIMRYS